MPLPALPEQREIVRRVDVLFALADKIEARVAVATARVEKITQAVLAKAFRHWPCASGNERLATKRDKKMNAAPCPPLPPPAEARGAGGPAWCAASWLQTLFRRREASEVILSPWGKIGKHPAWWAANCDLRY